MKMRDNAISFKREDTIKAIEFVKRVRELWR